MSGAALQVFDLTSHVLRVENLLWFVLEKQLVVSDCVPGKQYQTIRGSGQRQHHSGSICDASCSSSLVNAFPPLE